MENGLENGALAEGEPVDEASENQVLSSSDGEGDVDDREEGAVQQQQPPPQQPQTTNVSAASNREGGGEGPVPMDLGHVESGAPALDAVAPTSHLEDNLCDKDVDSDAADDDNDDEVRVLRVKM